MYTGLHEKIMRPHPKGEIKRMEDPYNVIIPFRKRNTVRNRLKRWFPCTKKPEEQNRFPTSATLIAAIATISIIYTDPLFVF
jgi:hypothetical protein